MTVAQTLSELGTQISGLSPDEAKKGLPATAKTSWPRAKK